MPRLAHSGDGDAEPKDSGQVVYLDYHATTPVDPRVADLMLNYLRVAFGNASSMDHAYGDEAENAVATARGHVAALVGAAPRNVIFTSGATESANLAICGFAEARNGQGREAPLKIALTTVEHHSVLDTCQGLERNGRARLRWLPVDSAARVDLGSVEAACRDGCELLCLMAANNEVGTIYPLKEVGRITRAHGTHLLSDATQAVGKIPVQFEDWGLSFLCLSAHKLYGPKGVGALIVAADAPIRPIMYGGGHQRGLRPGTLNVPGIAALGEACRLRADEMVADESAVARKRDRLESLLADAIPEVVVNGDTGSRLAGNLHISVPDVPNGAVIGRIRHRVAISTGAACSSGIEAPSHVLRAMNLPEPVLAGALRISLGKFTTDADITFAAGVIAEAVRATRQALRAAS